MSRLLLVDDHAIVRSGLRRLLESLDVITKIDECASGEEAYQFLRNTTADIIIMDISMPGKGGIESTSLIKKRYPKTKILILSMHDSTIMIKRAKIAGASGYILKNEISDNLLAAVQKVLGGEDIFPLIEPDVSRNILGCLSGKEFEIFKSIANGQGLHLIAEKMNVSYKTVANYQSAIKKKLNIRSVFEFQAIANEHDLIM